MIYYLGFGANLGNKIENVRNAIELVKNIFGVELLKISSFYETEAWGVKNQPNFINATAKIQTELEPLQLLDELQKIEYKLGRVRTEHWAARTLDIDILLAENFKITSERLTIPHPYLYERDFVLIPLNEILPTLKFNLHGDKVEKVFGSPKDFKLKIIACVDKNFGLGYKNNLLFKIEEDLKNFRELTLNNTIIYGRKTLQTFPKTQPLELRRNIIFSTTENFFGAEVVKNVGELWKILKPGEKNFVIGGEKIFNELLPYSEEIFLTVVDAEKSADVFFPKFENEFELASVKKFSALPNFEFRKYLRM